MTRLTLFALALAASFAANAGFDEGYAAYKAKDFTKAHAEWLPLANQGNVEAQKYLGLMYAIGQGVPQDFKEAIRWTRKAAEQGDPAAQLNLGIACYNGQGVAQDYKAAADWFRKAAAQGHPAAQGSLGMLYAKGHGVPKLRVVAAALYTVSATNDKTGAVNANKNGAELRITETERPALDELIDEMKKPNNLLAAIDKYARNPAEKTH